MKLLEQLMTTHPIEDLTPMQLAVSMGASVLFGFCGMWIYRIYHRESEPHDPSVSRSFPLIAPAVTATFLMIRFSLPLSVGLLGTLSFVRFRSQVKRAEDLCFILIAVSLGLASAVNQFVIPCTILALTGTYAVIRRMLGSRQALISSGNVAIHSEDPGFLQKWNDHPERPLSDLNLVSMTSRDALTSLYFTGQALDPDRILTLRKLIQGIDSNARVEFFFPQRD